MFILIGFHCLFCPRRDHANETQGGITSVVNLVVISPGDKHGIMWLQIEAFIFNVNAGFSVKDDNAVLVGMGMVEGALPDRHLEKTNDEVWRAVLRSDSNVLDHTFYIFRIVNFGLNILPGKNIFRWFASETVNF